MEEEYILCAAIWFDDGNKYMHQPKNIECGLVFCGYRHPSIFAQIGGTVKERQDIGIYQKELGFLTSQNRFVGRKEAARIAFEAKQTDRLLKRLYSEDLYSQVEKKTN